jgi:phosphoesterase RecJ-like protein
LRDTAEYKNVLADKKNEILNLINNSKNVLILTHKNPDGDAAGAVFALARALKNNNIRVKFIFEDYNHKFDIINPFKNITEIDYSFDISMECLLIILDCGSIERLGKYKSCLHNKIVINIDHHISNNNFGDYNFVDVHASSTCEIVYGFIKNITSIDDDIAAAIYAGIVSDTGGFRHICTTSNTYLIVSELLKFNFDFTKIYNQLMIVWTPEEIKMLSYVLKNLELHQEYKLALSYLTYDEIVNKSTGKFIEFIKSISNIEIAIMIVEDKKDVCKLSFRSEKMDVNKMAQKFGGGGHKLAAGGFVKMNLYNTKKKLIEYIKQNK